MKNMKIRLPMYFIGLFIMTIGVAISVKTNLGVSPVSSIPYTLTLVWGIEMGKASILFHSVLVVIQMIILRKNFKLISLLQVVIGIVFGYFTTFSNYIGSLLPTPDNVIVRLIMMLISTSLVAFGIFIYLPTNIMPLAVEGTIKAISDTLNTKFSNMKIAFDVTMVIMSAVICLITIQNLGSVGIGTVIAAVLVGIILGFYTKLLGKKRDAILNR